MGEPQKWDTEVQEIHGGQEWAELSNFVEDFSVTTNYLNTPKSGIDAIQRSIEKISHYPSADQEPAKTDLANFLSIDSNRLILGNGASEVIDLVVRFASSSPNNKTCLPGYFPQYKEYERSATTNGFSIVQQGPADLVCIVNPCNPTGQYKPLPELKSFILSNTKKNGFVLVDESMQPWIGNDFVSHSLLSATEWINQVKLEHGISIYIIHSWTKLWSCTGLRIGSVVCPTQQDCKKIKKIQVPWSVNCMAIDFISAVVKDNDYLVKTWQTTPKLRLQTIEKLATLKPTWKFYGEPFLSWVWVQTENEVEASKVVLMCKQHGVPIRQGSYGYKAMGYIRFAVREADKLDLIIKAIKQL